jgi:hypothetical protein
MLFLATPMEWDKKILPALLNIFGVYSTGV